MKLLLFDLETSPIVSYTWSLRPEVISPEQVITPASILCWGAKWYGSDEFLFASAQPNDTRAFKSMLSSMHALLHEADALVTYNGLGFDAPRLNNEFLRLGMAPPPPVHHIDLYRVVRAKFDLTSSKLAFLGPYLRIGEKVANSGWKLWNGCMEGDETSWRLMQEYNQGDVFLLEKLYDRLLPWIDGHPNHNLYASEEADGCPRCGGVLIRQGVRRASTQTYQRYQCKKCKGWSRSRFAVRPAKKIEVVC